MAYELKEIGPSSCKLHIDGTRKYTRVFLIDFDGPITNPKYVAELPELPAAGQPHPNDPLSYCVGTNPKSDSDPGRQDRWTVEVEYSERVNNFNLDDFLSGQSQDPELRIPDIEWGSNQNQLMPVNDRNGFRICNSAGDPPEMPVPVFESSSIATITYFVRQKPSGLMQLVNAVNASPLYFDGEQIGQEQRGGGAALQRSMIERAAGAELQRGEPAGEVGQKVFTALRNDGEVDVLQQAFVPPGG